jgi:hypothetical protein
VHATLPQLVADGFAELQLDDGGTPRYRLTALGMREGRRRFLDEFEPYLAKHGHGECGSADCDCHTGGGDCRSLA